MKKQTNPAKLSPAMEEAIAALAEAMAKEIVSGKKKEPIPTHAKRRAVMKEWTLIDSGVGELKTKLRGKVYGHPSFFDGEKVTTSPLLRIDIPERIAETMHTVYLLG